MRKKSTTLFPMWGSQPKSKYTCKYSYTRALCESFVSGTSIALTSNLSRIWNGFCVKHLQKWLVQTKMLCWLKYLYPLTRQVDLFHGNGGCLFTLVCMWPRHQPATTTSKLFPQTTLLLLFMNRISTFTWDSNYIACTQCLPTCYLAFGESAKDSNYEFRFSMVICKDSQEAINVKMPLIVDNRLISNDYLKYA